MDKKIITKGKNGEEYSLTITPKVDKGFIKINYMKDENHHNKNFKYEYIPKRDATAMLLFNYDYTKFYLVRQFRAGAMREMWEIPAGLLEDELTPLENTLKEVSEETGYKKEDILDICEVEGSFVSAGYSTEKMYIFIGRLKENAIKGEKHFDENENISGEGFFTFEEAKKLGAFEDFKTSYAYYYFKSIPVKKIGIIGGSFDPVTNLHIRLALRTIEEFDLNKIILEPVGDKYSYAEKKDITDSNHRLAMLEKAIKGIEKIEIGNYDIENSKKSGFCPTIELLEYYKKMYGNVEIYFICGSDNLKTISKWIEAEKLLSKYKIIVFQREGDNIYKDIIVKDSILMKNRKNIIEIHDIFENNISSSQVREALKLDISISGMIPESVIDYINKENLYK